VRSIRAKLTLIIIGTSVLAVGLVGVSARWITHTQFNTFRIEQTRSAFIDSATAYYRQNGSWNGAEVALEEELSRILGLSGGFSHGYLNDTPAPSGGDQGAGPPADGNGMDPPAPAAPEPQPHHAWTAQSAAGNDLTVAPPTANDRFERRNPFALANAGGVTVIGNHRWNRGQAIPAHVLAGGTPVTLAGERIGTVTYDAPPELRALERIYLARTGRAISYAAIAAFALALAVGVFGTRFFTRPIRDLTGAIRKMRAGDLEQTVPARSNDEFGEMARAFNDMSAEVARSLRLREQMTADIAHDLRSPLAVLTGYLESIRDGVLDATPDAVDTMYQEATQLQRLVEDLRTLSMADAGRLRLLKEAVDAGELLRSTRQSFAPMAEQAGVRVEIAVDPSTPKLYVDPSRLHQVLANLVANALHHTPAGGRVRLSAHREGGGVALVVQDDGAGIPPEALPHVFERFYRADAARTPSGGSGLGLPIARSLVAAHGGTIEAASEHGHGTTITVRLPEAEA